MFVPLLLAEAPRLKCYRGVWGRRFMLDYGPQAGALWDKYTTDACTLVFSEYRHSLVNRAALSHPIHVCSNPGCGREPVLLGNVPEPTRTQVHCVEAQLYAAARRHDTSGRDMHKSHWQACPARLN